LGVVYRKYFPGSLKFTTIKQGFYVGLGDDAYPPLFNTPRKREMPGEEGSTQIIGGKSGS